MPADGLRYGALALPLAFLALPLYVNLPSYYATQFGLSLAVVGAILLVTRALDALADPFIGVLVDRMYAQHPQRIMGLAVGAAVWLALGFVAVFFPPVAPAYLLLWLSLALVATYLAFSVLTVLHQSWGASWGGSGAQRAQIVSWREAFALAGVVLGTLLPALAGMLTTAAALALLLAGGVLLLGQAPPPLRQASALPVPTARVRAAAATSWTLPMHSRAFRALVGVFMLNGIASAIPASLVLFFVRDRLELPQAAPLFLVSYFLGAALSMPLWVQMVRRFGLPHTWLMGMGLAVLAFSAASLLGAGDLWPFWAVCVVSGMALGADLAVPSALLAGVIHRAGHGGQFEGLYLGWWNLVSKLNLALAAGAALPLLQLAGYAPGTRQPEALQALSWGYVFLPCVLKTLAAALLLRCHTNLEEET